MRISSQNKQLFVGASASNSTELAKSEYKWSKHNKEASRDKESSWERGEKGWKPIIQPFETSRIDQKDQKQEGLSMIYDDSIHQLY